MKCSKCGNEKDFYIEVTVVAKMKIQSNGDGYKNESDYIYLS